MRLLFLILFSLALVSCTEEIHDDTMPTEQFYLEGPLFVLQASYYGETKEGGDEEYDDPWDSIQNEYGVGTVHSDVVKNGEDEHDDPWDTIQDKFGVDSIHKRGKGKSGKDRKEPCFVESQWPTNSSKGSGQPKGGEEDDHDDPWNTITDKYPTDSTHGYGASGDGSGKKIFRRAGCLAVAYREVTVSNPLGASGNSNGLSTAEYSTGEVKEVSASSAGQDALVEPKEPVTFVLWETSAERAWDVGYVSEIRGSIALVQLVTGEAVYVVDFPGVWGVGTRVEVGPLAP